MLHSVSDRQMNEYWYKDKCVGKTEIFNILFSEKHREE